MKRRGTDEIGRDVLSVLMLNYGKPVAREHLAMLVGASDRVVRKAIEELRRKGEPIGKGEAGGYSYGRQRDVERTIRDYYAKALTNLEVAKALERNPNQAQVTIEDLMEF